MPNKRKQLLARSASPASKRTKQLHINENSSIEEFISFLKSELALEEVDYDEDTKKKWEKAFGHLQENVNGMYLNFIENLILTIMILLQFQPF